MRRRTVDRRHDELDRGVSDDRGGSEDSNARSSPPSPKHKADQKGWLGIANLKKIYKDRLDSGVTWLK